ncbi:MAG: hypothetical protein N2D54_06600, partial [Chloroflexota bacterium]
MKAQTKIVSVSAMLAIEKEADAGGWTYKDMMETAGNKLEIAIANAHSHEDKKLIVGLIGKGNNGGDALIALAALAEHGWTITAYVVGD